MFWLDLWKIFFLATLGIELGTSGSLVLHSTIVPMATSGFHLWQFQVFNSGAEGLVVVLFWLDLWEIFFLATLRLSTVDLWISSPVLYNCAMATSGFHLWQFQVFNSGAEGLVVVLFWLDLWEIFFLGHSGVWTGEPLDLIVMHSTTVTIATSGFHLWQFQVYNSGAEGLVVVIVHDWTCERLSIWSHWGLNWGSLDL